MPYFQRKSWQATIDDFPKIASIDSTQHFSFAKAAEAILTSETLRKQRSNGPFRNRKEICAGEVGIVVLSISATSDGGPVSLDFSASDLRSQLGDAIPGCNVSLSPQKVEIAPGGRQVLEVHVSVPDRTEPGIYVGRVFGSGPEPIDFLLEFEVSSDA